MKGLLNGKIKINKIPMKTSGKSWARYIDKSIKAKKVGYRKSSVTGERYYEARPDHSDSNPKERYADGGMMAKGGAIYKGDKVLIKDSNKSMVIKDISKGKKGYVEFSGDKGTYLKGDLERFAKGGKLDAGVYRIGKPKKVDSNLYAQKIVEIFDNGDIATASDYGRNLSDFKVQKYPIISEKVFEEQYKYAKGGKTKQDPPIVRGYFEDEAIDYAQGGKIKRGSGADSNFLMGYEPYFEKDVAIATIYEKAKQVRPTHGYFPKHPMSKRAINWAKKNGYTYVADGKKYEDGGMMSKGGNTDNTPKIYVADLEAYNNGKLKGQWVDLSDYDNGEEVMQKIGEIVGDNEYAIHDYENFSRSLYSESMGEDDFDKIIQIYKVSEDRGIPAEVLGDVVKDYNPDDLEEWIDEHYEGEFSSDRELAENYVEQIGGVAELGQDTLERYFDYESFGRDLAYDYSDYDGHYFRSYARGGTMGKSYDLKKYVFNTGFNYSIGGL